MLMLNVDVRRCRVRMVAPQRVMNLVHLTPTLLCVKGAFGGICGTVSARCLGPTGHEQRLQCRRQSPGECLRVLEPTSLARVTLEACRGLLDFGFGPWGVRLGAQG